MHVMLTATALITDVLAVTLSMFTKYDMFTVL
jgi:hypothetical protein